MHTKFLDKNFNGRDNLGDVGLCGKFILKWLFDKENMMMWVGLICLGRVQFRTLVKAVMT